MNIYIYPKRILSVVFLGISLILTNTINGAAPSLKETTDKINALATKINELTNLAFSNRNNPQTMLQYTQLAEEKLKNNESLFKGADKITNSIRADLVAEISSVRNIYEAIIRQQPITMPSSIKPASTSTAAPK